MDKTLRQFYRSVLKFLVPLNPKETYKTIVEEAKKLTGADYGSIFLARHESLVRVYSSVPDETRVQPRKRGFAYKAYKKRQPLLISVKEMQKFHPEFAGSSIKSIVLIPLSYHINSIGVLTLQSEKVKFFSKEKLDILKVYGSMASLAVRKTQLYSEVKSALETRDLFISLASHELRTPLTTINGYTQLIKRNAEKGKLPDKKWLEVMGSETMRLRKLIDELLQVDQMKSKKFRYEWKECSVRDVVKRAIVDFEMAHPEHNLLFRDEMRSNNDLVIGDFDKLLQAFLNILNNAAKFSNEGSKVLIKLTKNHQDILLNIRDEGRGIPKGDIKRIFEGFYKGNHHAQEGMGLGLFLTKNIVDQHKGTIKVRSSLGKGTSVEIALPGI